jgi:hypothetical protein
MAPNLEIGLKTLESKRIWQIDRRRLQAGERIAWRNTISSSSAAAPEAMSAPSAPRNSA